MHSNLYSLISAAVENYSWRESSHPFIPQDKNVPSSSSTSLSLSLYHPPLVFTSAPVLKKLDWDKDDFLLKVNILLYYLDDD